MYMYMYLRLKQYLHVYCTCSHCPYNADHSTGCFLRVRFLCSFVLLFRKIYCQFLRAPCSTSRRRFFIYIFSEPLPRHVEHLQCALDSTLFIEHTSHRPLSCTNVLESNVVSDTETRFSSFCHLVF